jgi:DNA-binding transcriptional LysR family regulator
MEFKQLRSFIEVVHRGGFTQAAHPAHQPVGGEQAGRPAGTGCGPAAARAPGSQLLLTAAGRIVLERGEALLRQRQALLNELDDLSQMARGELRLGLPIAGQ